MSRIRGSLSYSSIAATIALFFALSGGIVMAAGKFSGRQLKPNSLPGNRIKRNSIGNQKLHKRTLRRDRFASGTLPGLTVLDIQANNLPGATTDTPPGPTPVSFTGSTTFTPKSGKVDLLSVELKGNPVDADGAGGPNICGPAVFLYANGVKVQETSLLQDLSGTSPPFGGGADPTNPYQGHVIPFISDANTPQTLTAKVFGDPNCGPGTILNSFHVTVTELG